MEPLLAQSRDFRAYAPHHECRAGTMPSVARPMRLEGVLRDFEEPSRFTMLSYTITFLVVALIAGVLGFTGIAGTAAGIAKICFVLFLLLFIVSFITGRRAA